MTCECGHSDLIHIDFANKGSECALCDCTKYKMQTKNESSPDEAYLDRNLAVQVMAKMALQLGCRVGVREREEEWPILYIDLPTGQVSWHIPKDELIPGLPDFPDSWDGHDLKTKRKRLIDFVESM